MNWAASHPASRGKLQKATERDEILKTEKE